MSKVANSPPTTARTLIFDLASKTLNLKDSGLIPKPDNAKQDHLIQVRATALCAGELQWPFSFPEAIFTENPEKQITPGYDLAGVVITSPPGSPFNAGDEIYARTLPSRPGNCREFTIARTGEMALKPSKLDWVHAATVPLSAITAWQALYEHAGLDRASAKGKRIVVTAAAGGVGVWVVQFASILGLEVVAQIGSPENDAFIRSLGASKTINYKTTSLKDWAEREESADIVIDLIGGKTLEEAWYCVKDGGVLISIVEPPQSRAPQGLAPKDVSALFFIMEPNGQQLTEISELLEAEKVRTVVDSVWNLEEYEKAFERLESRRAKGKVVINIAA